MGFRDIDKLRGRTPHGLEIVRGIITVTERALHQCVEMRAIGRRSFTFGDVLPLEVDVSPWNEPPRSLGVPSVGHRSITVRALDYTLEGRVNPQVNYDVIGRPPIVGDVALQGDDGYGEADSPKCGLVTLAGEDGQGPYLFAEGELDALDPRHIERRLAAFRVVVSNAVRVASGAAS